MIVRLLILLCLAGALVGGGYYAVRELYIKPEQRLASDKQLPPPTPPPDPSIAEFDKCLEIRRTGPVTEARLAFERFLKEFPGTKKRDAALDVIGEINSEEFFAAQPTEENTYVVVKNDSLSRIATKRKISIELLVYLNHLNGALVHPGQRLLAPTMDFHLTLQQNPRRVVLSNGGKFFRQYAPLSWPGMHKNPPVFLPKASGKVIEKVALGEHGAIKPMEQAYFGANHLLSVTMPGHSLFTQPPDPAVPAHRPSGGGIGLAPAHMSEIAILLPKGAPVTLE